MALPARAVTVAEGQKMAEKFAAECHSCTYMEASAKANVNVEEVFVSIVRRVLQLDNEAGNEQSADGRYAQVRSVDHTFLRLVRTTPRSTTGG